jgi:hypothetical protein
MAITPNVNSRSANTIALPQRVWCARIYDGIMLGKAKKRFSRISVSSECKRPGYRQDFWREPHHDWQAALGAHSAWFSAKSHRRRRESRALDIAR